jgi:CRISPR/Cas system-associated exonuclease Cas4 (RecB family)
MDFAVLHEAFAHKFPEKINKAHFGYYDILASGKKFVEYETNIEDSKALRYWCSAIEEDENYVPRRGLTSYCKKCPFDKPCSKWSNWEVKGEQ